MKKLIIALAAGLLTVASAEAQRSIAPLKGWRVPHFLTDANQTLRGYIEPSP
jgi:hypothetical protein